MDGWMDGEIEIKEPPGSASLLAKLSLLDP
jgi:hypothetical protein